MRAARALSALVLVCCFCPPAPAQAQAQGKKPGGDKKDPQASYEPRSKPGVGQKFLQAFVGEWDVAKTFYPRSGDPARQKGVCRQAMVQGGRFLQSDFTFLRGDEKTTGTGLIGFDPAAGLFTSVWIDSRSTRMSFRQSKDRFDGKQIVLHSRPLGEGKERRQSHTVTRLEDDGRKIVHRQYTAGEGGKDRLVMELVMTRKAKPAGGK
jgi:hypothetical protein